MEKEVFNKKVFYLAITIVLFFYSIKCIFCDFDYDAEYALVMGYRLAKGDKMFLQMWEPHQTSAFLCAILIKIYLSIFETTTGIVLYMQVCGIVLRLLFAIMLNRTLKKYLDSLWSILLSSLFL